MAYGEMWEIELVDEYSGKKASFKGSDKHVVEQKARMQRSVWNAEKEQEELNNLLLNTLNVKHDIEW